MYDRCIYCGASIGKRIDWSKYCSDECADDDIQLPLGDEDQPYEHWDELRNKAQCDPLLGESGDVGSETEPK